MRVWLLEIQLLANEEKSECILCSNPFEGSSGCFRKICQISTVNTNTFWGVEKKSETVVDYEVVDIFM